MKKEHYRKIIFNTLISSDAIMIVFDSVCILSKKKKKFKSIFFFKKTETGSNRPVSVRFGSGF